MWTKIGKSLSVTLIATLILFPFIALAEDVSFEATVNSNKVSLSDMVELTLSVHGAKGDVSVVPLPSIDGFDTRYVGPATKFTIVNGVSSNEHSFIYNLFPSKVGHYQIPSVSLSLDGQTYQSSPIDIEVVDKPVESSNPEESAGTVSEGSINDKVFMRVFIAPQEVYVGEQTPLLMKVFVNGLSLQLASVPTVNPDGFTADATANMRKSKEIINGVNYESLIFDTNIYPTKTGMINVGPFQAQGELVYRMKQSNDIFGDLFANTQSRPITLHAPAISLHVLPLPSEGKPQDFSGAVGQYDFKASVSPVSVKVGDPITLHMAITGQGHLKDLVLPVFSDSRFKTYDPQTKDTESSKVLEQVIIPTDKNITEVPALSFSYFDPQEKKYKTITQGPFSIKVLATAAGEEFKAYGFVDKTKTASDKPFVVKYDWVQDIFHKILKQLTALFKDLLFWVFVVSTGVLWFVFYMWKEFQNRLKKDEIFAREWKADSKAKELLKNTKTYLAQNNSKEFYSSLYKTLNDYLADKMHIPLAGLSWSMIEAHLKECSVDPFKLQTIKDLFDRCDLVRFASASIDDEQMRQDFEQLQNLIAYLPKILK